LQRWLIAYRDELKAQLTKSTARVKIVFAHHPLYTAGKNHGQVPNTFPPLPYFLILHTCTQAVFLSVASSFFSFCI
jgi:hypothetical protein